MTVIHPSGPAVQAAFQQLRSIVEVWHDAGRTAATAAIKPALMHGEPPLRVEELGFESFSRFLDAAIAAGAINRYRTAKGHWILLPHDAQPPAPQAVQSLRSDLWRAFVDWTDGLERRWDTELRTTIMLPVDDSGAPLWESRPDRFVKIPAITQSQQIGWMKEFAGEYAEQRPALESALEPESMRGEWLRTLRRLDLTAQWRSYLQSKVIDAAETWATTNAIAVSEIMSLAPSSTQPSVATTATATATRRRGQGGNTGAPGNLVEQLRGAVHAAVDAMSFEELAALQIRALHLLNSAH